MCFESFFIPFDPIRKKTEATIKTSDGELFYVCKGAPQVVLKMCHPDEPFAKEVTNTIDNYALKGYRTLGIAKGDHNGKWSFLGLIPLFDPPRDDTKDTLDQIKSMGVDVKMATGDHTSIAKELAKNLNLGTKIFSLKDLYNHPQSNNALEQNLSQADGFSEVFPEHKFKIVQNFQKHQHVVGMTGDGVNDAPALKQADIGIAVGNATDAARQAADLILTQPGLFVIKKAIDEARFIFGRMKSYAMYRISETCRLLLFLLLSMLIFDAHPLSAMMIIVIALLNDLPIMMIAYDHMPAEKKPVSWNMKEILTLSIGLGIIGVISTFGLYWIGLKAWGFSPDQGKTLAFMAILCGGNLTIYLTRNRKGLLSFPLPEWKFFLSTLLSQIIGTLVAVYGLDTKEFLGIGWKYAAFSWVYILIWFGICLITKIILYHLLEAPLHHRKAFLEKVSKPLHGPH